MAWCDDASVELSALRGQTVQAVELLEWAAGDMADGMVAVSFIFTDGWMTIYNVLDENGIDFGGPRPEYRPHQLGS